VEFGADVHVFPNNHQQSFPDITISDNGIIHVTWVLVSGSNKDIYYSYSSDNGFSFSEAVKINDSNGKVVAFIGGGPRVRCRNDEVFISWADKRNGYTNTGIYLAQSTDSGNTWVETGRISDVDYFTIYPELEVGDDGKLHTAYYHYGSDLDIEDVRYAYTEPNSIEFYPSIQADVNAGVGEPCDCCSPELAIGPDGSAYIAFRNNINNLRDNYIAVKRPNMNEFSTGVPIYNSGWMVSYCPSSRPYLAVNESLLGVGFRVEQPANTYLAFSNSDSIEFNPPTNSTINGEDSNQDYSSVTFVDNNLHAVWSDDISENKKVRYGMISQDDSVIQNSQNVADENGNDALQSDPIITSFDNTLYCVWSDNRNGIQQIYFSSSSEFTVIAGDINQDNEVNIIDIVNLVNFILGHDNPSASEMVAGDMDENGILNILDIIQIVNLIIAG